MELIPIQIDSALKRWILYVQGLHFARDIGALRRKADLPRNSLLLRFNPYIDHENLLRIGGRLQNSNLSLDERSPKDVQIEVGRLCVIRSELMPPCKWLLARIIEVFPGKDGLIRVVRLKTANSVLMRPVAKISVLPLEENYSRKIGEGGWNVRVYCSNVKAVTAECKH
ncbi:hypothetical protein TKK_0002866 [Trichogramma kaykai]